MIVFPFFCSDSSIAGVDEVHSEIYRLRLMPFVTTFIVVLCNRERAFKRTVVLYRSNCFLPIACSVTSISLRRTEKSEVRVYPSTSSKVMALTP